MAHLDANSLRGDAFIKRRETRPSADSSGNMAVGKFCHRGELHFSSLKCLDLCACTRDQSRTYVHNARIKRDSARLIRAFISLLRARVRTRRISVIAGFAVP